MYGGEWSGQSEPIYCNGRERPICYRLRHPLGGRPLMVLGHYEVTCGGCDTIGDLDQVFRLATDYACSGHDVLLEGWAVSREYQRSAVLAARHRLHILRLSTPLDQCIRNVIARRHARRDARPLIAKNVAMHDRSIDEACAKLQQCAEVEVLSFEDALWRALDLLGVGHSGSWHEEPIATGQLPVVLGHSIRVSPRF